MNYKIIIGSKLKDRQFKKSIIIGLVIFIVVILILNWFIKSDQAGRNNKQAENFNPYYKNLLSRCGDKEDKNYGCCFNSVQYMSVGGFKLSSGLGCRAGFKLNTFNCQNSYKWCEPIR